MLLSFSPLPVGDSTAEFRTRHAAALARLAKRAGARWNVDPESMAEVAQRAVESAGTDGSAIDRLLDSLRAEDLALAIACRDGNADAWEHFITRLRPPLYAAARAITGSDSSGRELADSLWGDMYGLEVRDGRRRSILDYYHGRSSLLTWMRAVLAQRHIDSIRAARRSEPLEGRPEPASEAATDDPPEPDRVRYVQLLGLALDTALARVAPRDRMRMGYYYRHGLSLKEIGRLMSEHESSVSRNLARTRDGLKREIEHSLVSREGLNREQVRLCYDYAATDLKIDLARALPEAKAK